MGGLKVACDGLRGALESYESENDSKSLPVAKSSMWKGVAKKIAGLDEILEQCDELRRGVDEAKASTTRLEDLVTGLKDNQLSSLRDFFVRKVKLIEQCELEHEQQVETAAQHEERGQAVLGQLNEVLDRVSKASPLADPAAHGIRRFDQRKRDNFAAETQARLERGLELRNYLENRLSHLETFRQYDLQAVTCLKELGEREVTIKEELQPLQGRLAANWEELRDLEDDFRLQNVAVAELRDDVDLTIERHL